MRSALTMVAVAAVVALSGCKKQEEIEAPVPEAPPPPPAPTLVWTWGTATLAGGDAGVGKLNVPVTVQNNTDGAFVVRAWDVGVDTESGRVCVARAEDIEKAAEGATTTFVVKADCQASKLPVGETLSLLGSVDYSLGGESLRLSVDQDVDFNR